MLNYLSICVTPLQLVGPSLHRHATGFFYAKDEHVWLVSNWHVFSGRNVHTGQPRSKTGAVPNTARFGIPKELDRSTGWYDWEPRISNLYTSHGEAIWFQHPTGQEIDVAVLPLGLRASDFNWSINLQKHYFDQLTLNSGEDVYIIGYPLNIKPIGDFPIWKRASFATFPTARAFDKPAFLMDSATREGMSGSPVIFPEKQMFNMNYGGLRIGNGRYKVAGVYSGRFEDESDALGASLAVGWHASVIDEIIDSKIRGGYVLKSPSSPI